VIVTPNEYGDFLSDMLCGLIGSGRAGRQRELLVRTTARSRGDVRSPAAPHPTSRAAGLCNPTAALLALASLLRHVGELDAKQGAAFGAARCDRSG
jgi:isocitrate dehydrogenase (NAD+)